MRLYSLAVPLFVGALWCAQVRGQAQTADLARLERQLENQLEQVRRDTRLRVDPDVPVGQRALFQYGAYLSMDYLSLDDQNGQNRVLWQPQLFVYSRLNLDGVHELFLRGRTSYRDFGRGDEFDNEDDEWLDPKLERAVYQFDLQRHVAASRGVEIDHNVNLAVGRDLVYWANGLVLNQVLDGAQATLSSRALSLRVLVGRTDPDVVDLDFSRPGFDDDTRRLFFGAMLGATVAQKHRPYAYVLVQQDHNHDQPLVLPVGAPPITTRFEYDSYYLGVGSSGAIGDRLVYAVEAVYEGGNTLSNSFDVAPDGNLIGVPQTKDPIEAAAFDARLEYLVPDERQTRLSAEVILATGDQDRRGTSTNTFAGNEPGTPDHAFNALGLLNTGIAFNPSVSNLAMLRVGASTLPAPQVSQFRRLQVGADFFVFCKLRADAPVDEPTDDQRFLGVEPDLFVNWRMTSDVTLALRYGLFFPSDAILGSDETRQTLFVGFTVAF